MFTVKLTLAIYLFGIGIACSAPLPDGANIINVKQFGAKGDGSTDDTKAILLAIEQLPPFDVRHPWQTKIIYFPSGTYIVTDTISRRDPSGKYQPGLILIGETQGNTVIKLADNSPGFQDKARPKPLIFTASGLLGGDSRAGGKDPVRGEGNDAYVNFLENLTIEIGKANSGAIGLDYLGNNIGAVRDVAIRAIDRGQIGLSMTRKWVGPALIQRVRIDGFDIGIDVSGTEYSVTLDDVSVSRSRQFGLRNRSNSVPFVDLKVDAESGVGIANLGSQALMTGIRAQLRGRGAVAFQNTGWANVQSVDASKFVLEPLGLSAADLDGVYEGDRRVSNSLWRLPIASSSIPSASSQEWANVQEYGAVADPSVDSTRAIAAAFRSGAKAVFFPTGQYKVTGTIAVPAALERIDGMFSTIFAEPAPGRTAGLPKYPLFTTGPRSAPLVLRRLIVEGRGGSYGVVEHQANSPLLIQDIVASGVGLLMRAKDGGPVFAENVSCTGGIRLSGSAGIWFRQLNVEAHGTMIENDGAPLWVLGAKTEQTLSLVSARNQADIELVGGLVYRVKPDAKEVPLLISENSRLVASYAEEAFFPNAVYAVHLVYRRNDSEVSLNASDLPLRGKFGRVAAQIEVGN